MTKPARVVSSTHHQSTIRAIQSPTAAVRLREARTFVDQFAPGDEVLLLGASRGAVDDFARAIAMEKGATFGLHRLSFTQLAARLATLHLASLDRAPATTLGHEAVATRATFEADKDESLKYFAPVAHTPRISEGAGAHADGAAPCRRVHPAPQRSSAQRPITA